MVRFFMAGLPRTGTTLIRTTLDSHPDVRCVGESFLFGGRFRKTRGEKHDWTYRHYLQSSPLRIIQDLVQRTSVVNGYLDELYAANDCSAIGFKLMQGQSEKFPMVMKYIHQHKIRAIHVVRKNVLKTLISLRVYSVTRRAKSTSAVTKTQITLREDNLLARLETIHRANELWQKQCEGLPYLRVNYEDFVADKEAELQRMLTFLDIQYVADLKSSLVKVNPNDIREVILNYDAVERKLAGTQFEWCLNT